MAERGIGLSVFYEKEDASELNGSSTTLDFSANHSFNIYYQNARGLRTKTRTLYENILVEDWDLICLSETWLNDSFSNSELCDNRYVIYRNDKDYVSSNVNRGGGVLLCAKKKYKPTFVAKSNSIDFQWLCIKIKLENNTEVLICCVYISCSSGIAVYDNFVESFNVYNLLTYDNLIFVGDFNVPDIRDADYRLGVGSGKAQLINALINQYDLYSINNVRNFTEHTLDLVLLNITEAHVQNCVDNALVSVDNYHPPLEISFLVKNYGNSLKEQELSSRAYDFKRGDFTLLYHLLVNQDWSDLEKATSADASLDSFYKITNDLLSQCIPEKKTPSFNKKFPKWFSKSLIHNIKLKKHYFKLSKKRSVHKQYYKEKYSSLRSRTKCQIKQCYATFLEEIQNDITHNPNNFWKFVKEKRDNSSISFNFSYEGTDYSDCEDISDIFAKFFQSVYTDGDGGVMGGCSYFKDYGLDNLTISMVTDEDILLAIKSLKAKASVGEDKIPSYFYKAYADILKKPIKILMNHSLKENYFPDKLKVGRITPVHKGGNTSLINNYRPITILPSLSKIFERILHTKISQHIKNIIIPQQHGFLERKSTLTNLTVFTEFVARSLGNGNQVDVIFTDLSKAFDKVNHNVLLRKLKNFSFDPGLTQYFRSYLENRIQFVQFNNSRSKQFIATSGVPQGSILGPLLFIMFINDITDYIEHSDFLLYADDLKIYNVINSQSDCESLQRDLKNLEGFCDNNRLELNISKCRSMSFYRSKHCTNFIYTIDNVTLVRVEEIVDLGVLFSKNLHFNSHVVMLCDQGMRKLGLIIRICKDFLNLKVHTLLFNAYVRSKLEYASVIWNPNTKTYSEMIEKIQKKFLRSMYYKKYGIYPLFPNLVSYSDQLAEFGVKTLEERRSFCDILFIFNILTQRTTVPELLQNINLNVPDVRLRRRNNVFKVFNSPSPLNRCLESVNNLIRDNPDFDIFAGSRCSLVKLFL